MYCSSIYVDGSNINYTGVDINYNPTLYTLSLINYRITKISDWDLFQMLTGLEGRGGALPATITINDYVNYASPSQDVLNAVASLKAAKSITTVNLGA